MEHYSDNTELLIFEDSHSVLKHNDSLINILLHNEGFEEIRHNSINAVPEVELYSFWKLVNICLTSLGVQYNSSFVLKYRLNSAYAHIFIFSLARVQILAIAESLGCLVWWEANAENAIIVTAGPPETKFTTYLEHVNMGLNTG